MKCGAITEKDIARAAQAILNDKIVVYPTETAYALGVNALSERAVEKLYALKAREHAKPTHISVLTIQDAEIYAHTDERAQKLTEAFLPGPLTLVLPTKNALPKPLEHSASGTCGIRVPNHSIAQRLLETAGVPITATSANASGKRSPYSISEIYESFGDRSKEIASILDAGTLPNTRASTIISLMNDHIEILREGPITLEEIEVVLS